MVAQSPRVDPTFHPKPLPFWARVSRQIRYRLLPSWFPLGHIIKRPEPVSGMNYVWLRAGSRCVKGNLRETNEDRCYTDANHGLFLVVDGMGGHHGGGEASRILLQTVSEQLEQVLDASSVDLPTMQRAVQSALTTARLRMISFAEQNPDCQLMGATMALAAVVDNMMYVAHAGDCRVYLVRENRIRRLTTDQTYVHVLVTAGVISPAEARTHPLRNRVMNLVGVRPMEAPLEVQAIPLETGDRVLLTTDGLTDVLDDEEIKRIVLSHGHPQSVTDQLVRAALQNESHDDIGCIAVKFVEAAIDKLAT